MPATTARYGIIYAAAADETKAFPAEVSKVGAEKIEEVIREHERKNQRAI